MQQQMPRITYAVFAYNQEKFVEDAVRCALEQDYLNLEIILSDDCSTDRTFERMQSMVAKYSGQHVIILNRNKTNLGIIQHINFITSIATGELIVGASGDDLSIAHRVTTVVNYWLTNKRRYQFIYSKAQSITEEGRKLSILGKAPHKVTDLRYIAERRFGFIAGATQVWTPGLLAEPTQIPSDVLAEDRFLAFRAWYKGGAFGFVDQVLVSYRIHSKNLSISSQYSLAAFKQFWTQRSKVEVSYLSPIINELNNLEVGSEGHNLGQLLKKELAWAGFRAEMFSASLGQRLCGLSQAPSPWRFLAMLPFVISVRAFPWCWQKLRQIKHRMQRLFN